MELEADYKRDIGHGSGSETAYFVEARYNYSEPIKIGAQIFDNRWRRVDYQESMIGVPRCANHARHTAEHNMLGYQAAQALRWWLHANATAMIAGNLCLETRILSCKISWTYSIEVIGAHEHIHGDDRSNVMPDYGVRPANPTR